MSDIVIDVVAMSFPIPNIGYHVQITPTFLAATLLEIAAS